MGRHTITARGRMVYVELLNGEKFFARFQERTSGMVVVFEDGRRIPAGQIKSFRDRPGTVHAVSKHRRIS